MKIKTEYGVGEIQSTETSVPSKVNGHYVVTVTNVVHLTQENIDDAVEELNAVLNDTNKIKSDTESQLSKFSKLGY